MTKLNWGGARNSKDRVTDALSQAQCEDFLDAIKRMVAKGMPPNRFITVHWERLGIAPADCMDAVSSFMRLARDWARKQGFELAVVWVRENDDGDESKGNHWHALYYVPEPILRPFLGTMTRHWLKQIAAGKYVPGGIATRIIGRRASDYRNAPELYRENLTKLAVGYFLKGASREAAFALSLPRWGDGGKIAGKRWGRSQNLQKRGVGKNAVMPVNRDQWAKRLPKLPAWDCPTCSQGRMKVFENSLLSAETGPSKNAHSWEEWEPEWIVNRFTALMQCDFASCKEIVAVSGNSFIVMLEGFDDEEGYFMHDEPRFEPKSIHPCPMPFRIPVKTPETVVQSISNASSLFWQSEEAAANNIRKAVECLMDSQKVRKRMTKNGKHTQLALHARIVEFKKRDPENADILLAIKWLGNTGSHSGVLEREDVLDAFDMIEIVLDKLYTTSKKELLRKVREINKRKGPTKKRKKP